MWPALIAAGASLAGGLINKQESEENRELLRQNAERNFQFQDDLAKMGVRWKVADARAAGISPLAALGAQTFNASPVSLGDVGGSSGLGNAIASMGQDVSRAVSAGQTGPEKVDAYTQSLRALQLEKGSLENELLRSQIMKMRVNPTPPKPTATPGDENPDLKTVEPHLMAGQTFMTQGGTSQASHIEDQYGEVADVIGLANWMRDVGIPYAFPGLIESLRRSKLRKSGSMFVSKRYRD